MLTDPLPPRDHMEVSFKQRRAQVVGDCHQLKNDVDYYTEKTPDEKPIKMAWDFTDDMDDLDQPKEYTVQPMVDAED
jgi:actin-related protein